MQVPIKFGDLVCSAMRSISFATFLNPSIKWKLCIMDEDFGEDVADKLITLNYQRQTSLPTNPNLGFISTENGIFNQNLFIFLKIHVAI